MARWFYPDMYPEHYACFHCRKSFKGLHPRKLKKTQRWNLNIFSPRAHACPQCGQPMMPMGIDFKAPKMRDVKAWERLEQRFKGKNVPRFESCRCCPASRNGPSKFERRRRDLSYRRRP